jgi:endonuclease I
VPFKITVSLDEGAAGQTSVVPAASAPAANFAAAAREAAPAASPGLAALRANANSTYYDAAQDETDRAAYYAGLDWSAGGEELYRLLSAKVRDTHTRQLGYNPSVELYPWVDLHPDRKIHSIYSGIASSPNEFIAHDEAVDRSRHEQLSRHLAEHGAAMAPLAALLENLEAGFAYNCEHSVPQSWFNKKAPMRGDLHHLFACETHCNSTRGNQPYVESPADPGTGNNCGLSGPDGFEPKDGKGAVARATLYFLLRYPTAIGDAARELQADRLSMLRQWHRDFPVTDYELHRNQAIFQRQGNRNPLIDRPDLADRIDFNQGFGHPPHARALARSAAASLAGPARPALFPFGQPRPLSRLQLQDRLSASLAGADVAAHTLVRNAATAMAEAADFRARSRFKPLPPAPGLPPFRLELASVLGAAAVAGIEQSGQLVFHSVGDTGQHGHGAEAQESVAFHLEQQVANAAGGERPALFYHLGDVVYYSGQLDLYPEQFYDPYQYYPGPIVAIPGNHDGDNVTGDRSLSAFVQNFCTATPGQPPRPGDSTRLTMIQPNVYFTLLAPFVTIIGLYSNVTGDLDDPNSGATPQYDWLVGELRAADPTKFLIVAVHHPVYSADNDHGGEKKIGIVLDQAFTAADRLPHLVLTAHVHDYQRYERRQTVGAVTRTVPYIVAGAGGYAGFDSLHRVLDGVPFPDDVTLVTSNDKLPGFLRLKVTAAQLTGEYFVVPRPPDHISAQNPATSFDTFQIPF